MIKVDLRKAYDTMDWAFLHDMLIALNLPPHFIKIVMVCITSTQYSLLVNGYPLEIFKPKRSLSQGDPLSPLLFVIGMEYLSGTLAAAGGSERFKFHPGCKNFKLNHLCFADDLMLFCRGDITSAQILCNCLDTFAASFSLHANASKLAIYLAGIPDIIQL